MQITDNITALRLPAALIVLVALAVWETVHPFLPLFGASSDATRQRLLHGARNVGLGLLNALVVRFVFLGLWLATIEWSRVQGFGLLHRVNAPAWFEWTLAFLVLDLSMYTWHRLSHSISFLWRFHRLHHTDRQMDVTTANRFHTGEIVLSSLARVAVLALLGCSAMQLAVFETVFFAVVQLHHANVAVGESLDRLLRVFIVTPHLHKVHHSVILTEQNANFSSVLNWWDRLLRTLRLSPNLSAVTFGVDDHASGTTAAAAEPNAR